MNESINAASYSVGDLPPSTLPSSVKLSISGMGDDPEWLQRFKKVVVSLLVECSQLMDLNLLDGVTIDSNYQRGLDSVDLGWETAMAKTVTSTEDIVGIAKCLKVKRDDRIMGHVVISGSLLVPLTEPDSTNFDRTLNIFVHELAHVATLGWFQSHSPGVNLEPYKFGWMKGQLQDAAHTIWEEYAACRLCRGIGGGDVEINYVSIVESSAGSGFPGARSRIKEYRDHGDTSRVYVEIIECVVNPMKYAAYLLGHIDGAEGDEEIDQLCPAWAGSEFRKFGVPLLNALRSAWESRLEWDGMSGVDEIADVILEAFGRLGVEVTFDLDGNPGRLNIPYRANTMPDD